MGVWCCGAAASGALKYYQDRCFAQSLNVAQKASIAALSPQVRSQLGYERCRVKRAKVLCHFHFGNELRC